MCPSFTCSSTFNTTILPLWDPCFSSWPEVYKLLHEADCLFWMVVLCSSLVLFLSSRFKSYPAISVREREMVLDYPELNWRRTHPKWPGTLHVLPVFCKWFSQYVFVGFGQLNTFGRTGMAPVCIQGKRTVPVQNFHFFELKRFLLVSNTLIKPFSCRWDLCWEYWEKGHGKYFWTHPFFIGSLFLIMNYDLFRLLPYICSMQIMHFMNERWISFCSVPVLASSIQKKSPQLVVLNIL